MDGYAEMNNYFGLSGLIFACPFGEARDTCPFKLIQALSIDSRIDYIESLSNNQLITLLTRHKNCLCSREIKSIRYSEKSLSFSMTEV